MLRTGPLVLGFTLIVLSFHPVLVEVIGWAIPISEQGERPLFASLALVLAGLALVVYGTIGLPWVKARQGAKAGKEKPKAT